MQDDKRRNTIIAIVAIIAIILILLISWIAKSISESSYTGGDSKNQDGAKITTDVSSVVDKGFPSNLYSDFSESFFQSMTVINPTCNDNAKTKNIETNGDTYTFKIVRCNETYDVELSNEGSKQYNYTITKDGEKLISYNSANKGKSYLAPESVGNFLPMNLTTDEGQKFTIKLKNINDPSLIEVGTSSCGNQDKKSKALEAAKDALEYTGFNPEDFNYDTPNYCDVE